MGRITNDSFTFRVVRVESQGFSETAVRIGSEIRIVMMRFCHSVRRRCTGQELRPVPFNISFDPVRSTVTFHSLRQTGRSDVRIARLRSSGNEDGTRSGVRRHSCSHTVRQPRIRVSDFFFPLFFHRLLLSADARGPRTD